MNTVLEPTSVEELVEAIHTTPRLIPVGAETKPRPSQVDAVRLSTRHLRGISEYDPSEFTFTAGAGTPVREIAAALAERGQYLPFDPLLTEAGATLGGTVASGVSGPGRFRFGGVRDFILGVRFVDGEGRCLRMGGKVVKNAAGFDLPKFFVGSLGRFGVLTEITFKVFPCPASSLSLRLSADNVDAAVRIMREAARSRFEFDALDVAPEQPSVLARICGPSDALRLLASEILTRWPGEILCAETAEKAWSDLREFRWRHFDGSLVKIALSPNDCSALVQATRSLEGARLHLSAGGNVAWLSLSAPEQARELNKRLKVLGLSGVALRGEGPLWLGFQERPAIAEAIKRALDPMNRFPLLDD